MRILQGILLLLILFTNPVCQAGDWPQILGPYRNAHAADETIAASWPAGGPELKWQRPVGSGFAGVAVLRNTLVLFHRVGDQEIVEALNAVTGEPIWKQSAPVSYRGTFNPNDGPIAVPLIHNNWVYTYGITGRLQCLELKTGKVVWSRDTHKEFQVSDGYFGVGSTPIIVEEKLLVNVGGKRKNAGVVAFSLDKGFTLWQALQDDASYSSPTSAFRHGRFYAIFITRLHLTGLDPKNGNVLFQFPFGKRGPTVNGADPVVIGNNIFATASYGVGGFWGQIEQIGTREIWRSEKPMSSQYTTPIEYDGKLIGIDGRQDIGTARLICFDPQTRKVAWAENDFGYATLLEADNKLIIMKTDGTLVLAEASLDAYKELASEQIFHSTTRALPALSNGLLYVRDSKTLKCLKLGSDAPVTPEKTTTN